MQINKWAMFHFYDYFNITLSITNKTFFDSSAFKVIGSGAIHGASWKCRSKCVAGEETVPVIRISKSWTIPIMPKCGHTLRHDVTANLLSTFLSFWPFYYKLGNTFNFSTGAVCLSDHHTRTLSHTLTDWVCPLGEKMVVLTALHPTLKKHLAP